MKSVLLFTAVLLAAPVSAQVRVITQSPHPQNPLLPEPVEPPSATPPIGLSTMVSAKGRPGDSDYRPEVGQAGKDVIWAPTSDELVKAMLATAEVRPGDTLVDLGSGDGRIAIAAARDFGARATGIEYNADLVALARRNAVRAGVADKVTFVQGDIFQTGIPDASVVAMYLLPHLNLKLRPLLLQMKPGTRIVSNSFSMGEWLPEKSISTATGTAYYWIVPANIAGRWAMEIGANRFAIELGQQFQFVTVRPGQPVRAGRLRGTDIELLLNNGPTLNGQVRGDQIYGTGWNAYRIRPSG